MCYIYNKSLLSVLENSYSYIVDGTVSYIMCATAMLIVLACHFHRLHTHTKKLSRHP